MQRTDVLGHTHSGDARFSPTRIWWLGCGFLGIQLAFATYNAFLPLMYREFFDSRSVIGLLMGTDNLVGLLLIPVIGAWSDRVTSPLGRRLPFVVIALPLAALTLFALPYAATLLWLLIVVEVAFTAAMHAYRGPYAALIVDHTPPERRSTASGIIQVMGGIGVLASFGGLSWLYDIDPRATFATGAVVLLATLGIVLWKAQRRPPHTDQAPVAARNPVTDALTGLRGLLREAGRGRLLILAAMLTAYVGFAGLEAMFPIYGVETLGLTEGRAAFMLSAFAASFLASSFLAGLLGTRFGEFPTMLLGLAVLPLLYVAAMPLREPWMVGVVLVLAGMAWPLFAIPAVALMADLGGRDRVGFHLGLYYVFIMSGQMVGPFVAGSAMDVVGNHGMWLAAAVITMVSMALLWAGRRALGDDPVDVARRSHLARA